MEETRPGQPRQRRLLSSYLLRSRDWGDCPAPHSHIAVQPLLAPEKYCSAARNVPIPDGGVAAPPVLRLCAAVAEMQNIKLAISVQICQQAGNSPGHTGGSR